MLLSKAEAAARNILKEYGIDSIESLARLNLKDLIQARGSYYEENEMGGEDGRKVSFKDKGIITINKSITDTGKKRFVAAHELGHFELHKNLSVTADTQYELCSWFQAGNHEKEANDFASELLMPSRLFRQQCHGKKFGQKLIENLSETFTVSRTAAILKFVKDGNHPVCVVCTNNNRVSWWKMSKEMETAEHEFIRDWLRYKIRITTNLPPPVNSVVWGLMKSGRGQQNTDRFQEIEKSIWFLTHPKDDPKIFEYCNFIPQYNFALSVIWED